MKTTLKKITLKSLMLLGLFISVSCISNEKSDKSLVIDTKQVNSQDISMQPNADGATIENALMATGESTFRPEGKLDVTLNPVPVPTATTQIKNGRDSLSTPTTTLPSLIENLDSASIGKLKRMTREHHSTHGDNCENYVTGLRITMGLNSNKDSISLLYQPVYCCKIGATDNFAINDVSSDFMKYSAVSHSFVSIGTGTLAQDYITRYKQNIRIKRALASQSNTFNPATDSTGDVKSVIFSFQELDSVILKNEDKGIKIWNYSFSTRVSQVKRTKHSLLLSPQKFVFSGLGFKKIEKLSLFFIMAGSGSVPGGGVFKGSFANRSHLCPPSCEAVIYRYAGSN